MYQNLITIINYIKFICFIHKRIKILDREKISFIQVKFKKKVLSSSQDTKHYGKYIYNDLKISAIYHLIK